MTRHPARGLPQSRGSITIELLVAFALFATLASSLALLGRTALDARYALASSFVLADMAENAVTDFRSGDYEYGSSATTAERDGTAYALLSDAYPVSPCLDAFSVRAEAGLQRVERTARKNNLDAVLMRGGDCAYSEPFIENGLISDFSIPGESGSAVDVLGDYAVIGLQVEPYLAVANAETGALVAPQNGFFLYAPVNAVDQVLVWENGESKRYAFLALASTSRQFAVVNLTDAARPVLIASSTLPGVDPAGSFPQGFRIRYFDGAIFVVVRETAGPELHAYDARDPAHLVHRGSLAVNSTLNDIDLRLENGKRILYAASARDSGELAAFDVTDLTRPTEILARRVDLPGSQDGRSIAILGKYAYLGRASNTGGPELIVFDISQTVPAVVGSGEVGTHASGITAVGKTAFITATPDGRTARRLEAWSIASTSPVRLFQYALPSLAFRGFDYDGSSVYVVREEGSVLERLVSP